MVAQQSGLLHNHGAVAQPPTDGTPRNVQPDLGPPRPAAHRRSSLGSATKPLTFHHQQQQPQQQSCNKSPQQQHQTPGAAGSRSGLVHGGAANGVGLAQNGVGQQVGGGAMSPAAAHKQSPATLAGANGVGVGVGVGGSSPAAAGAGAGSGGGGGPAVGAPVTMPGVVKTKAGRRGAIGPLLNRLRAEAAAPGADAGGGD